MRGLFVHLEEMMNGDLQFILISIVMLGAWLIFAALTHL